MELRRANDEASGPAVVFLPGIMMPAALRYAPLVRELGGDVRAFTKELAVYDAGRPPEGYSIGTEVEDLAAAIDGAGLDRYFVYGHSAGGAIGLAFAAAHPERLLGLALDEPASDFSEETRAAWAKAFEPLEGLPANERVPAFLRAQVGPGVELPAPAPGAPPEWMATRPAGMEAFIAALDSHAPAGHSSVFTGPVTTALAL